MNIPLVQSIKQESTATLIARQLRRLIGQGEIPLGTRLNETQLSRDFGVSRGPLREALQRLTEEGLLTSIRNRGVFVTELSEADMREVYTARSAIERGAAELIIADDPVGKGQKLLEIISDFASAETLADVDALIESDVRFHQVLVQLSDNSRLIKMHQTLMIETRMCMLLETQYSAQLFRSQEHRAIALAIQDGDEGLAVRLIKEHLSLPRHSEE